MVTHTPDFERVVLWFEDGKSNKVYVAELDGARWIARYGKRSQENRAEKVTTAASPEAARKSCLKAIAAKEKNGYRRAPTGDEARALIAQAFGFEVAERDGGVVLTAVTPREDNGWVTPGSRVLSFAHGQYTYITVIEELALFAASMKGREVYMEIVLGGGARKTSSLTIL